MQPPDPYQLARDFIEQTGHSIFLTGKAGSGKTTLLREIIRTTQKNTVVLAPTGIAAINAGGVTIHSFFTLPTRTFLPIPQVENHDLFYGIRDLPHHTRYQADKLELIRNLDLLIIDEISMCRADLLDAVNLALKQVRKSIRPFGGIQVLMIGDLYQLPPVVKDQEGHALKQYYKSPFFFDARVFEQEWPVQIELDKIYRQTDENYIRVLNHIRNNEATEDDYRILNQRYLKGDELPEDHIVITTHNQKADEINNRRLDALPGKRQHYHAEVNGDFQERSYPCESTLHLKEGARVMFIKNDTGPERRYYNGKLGVVTALKEKSIVILSDGKELEIERETWRNIRYTFNKEEETVEEEELGSYKQFPLRLAWAITVHKSQGLTFEKAVLDIGASFAPGQVYVALSRCTSLEGMILRTPLRPDNLRIPERVVAFLEASRPADALQLLGDKKTEYVHTYLRRKFSFDSLQQRMQELYEKLEERSSKTREEAMANLQAWMLKNEEFMEIATRFNTQVEQLLVKHKGQELLQVLTDRTAKATAYFVEQCYQPLSDEIDSYYRKLYRQKQTKKLSKEILLISTVLSHKLEQLYDIRIGDQAVYTAPRKTHKPEEQLKSLAKKSSSDITLEIFRECKDIAATAKARDMALSTIEGHLAGAVSQGKISAEELIGSEKLAEILAGIGDVQDVPLGELMRKTKGKYSYGELRLALAHLKK